MNLMSRIRALPVAPADGALSQPLSTAGMHAVRAARRIAGNRVGAGVADAATLRIVSKAHRFVLTTVPKAGTKSFQDAFLRAPEVETDAFGTDCSPDEFARRYGLLPDFHKVVFVRNPWTRVASCYHDKIVRSHEVGKITILSRFPGLYPKMPFREFVNWLISPAGMDCNADRHWISQHKLFTTPDGRMLADEVFRIEDVDTAFAGFCAQVGLPQITLHRKNADGGAKPALRRHRGQYFDRSTIELIGERYRADIEMFGYEFDLVP